MNKIDNKKLEQISGGGLSGTIITAIGNFFKIFLDIGRGIGSSYRRIEEGKLCPLK